MPRMRQPVFASIALLSLGASCCCAQSAAPAPESASRSVIRTNANLVLVDVVVTADGKPVEGLTKARFHIFENGHEQALTTFEEHRASDTTLVAAVPALPPNVYSNDPRFAIESAANVLLLDALNTPVSDQQYVRRQMIEYLKGIAPGTRIAVFTLGSQLRMISGFTTDAGRLEAAIRGGRGTSQQSPLLESPQDKDEEDNIASDLSSYDGGAMEQFLADRDSFQMDMRVRTTLDAMEELGRYLNGIPGRKNLIWFSGSFPLQIAPDPTLDPAATAAGGASPLNLFNPTREYSAEIRQTDALLAAARVAVYPVDARGLMTLVSADASRSFASSPFASPGASQQNAEMGPRSRVGRANTTFLQQMTDEHQTMQQMAGETGGEAFYNGNDLKGAVAQAVRNGSNYYTLGYVPQEAKWDGSFRRIAVRVDGGRYELSYRRGYYADDPLKPGPETPGVASPIVAALERGAPPLAAIRFEARVLPANDPSAKAVKPQPGPAGEMATQLKPPVQRYLVDLSVDPHGMEWSALKGNVAHAEIEVAMVVWDAEGKRVNYTDRAFAIDLNPQQSAVVLKNGLPVHQEIDLPAGEMYLRIAVHDLRDGRIGAIEVPLTVAKNQENSPRAAAQNLKK